MSPKPQDKALAVATLAVQLSREYAGRYSTVFELARDADALVSAAVAAREALARGRSAKAHYSTVEKIARAYSAQLEPRGDLEGMVVGLRFTSGSFTSGFENIFYVS